jgi:hypothetical protein
MRIPIIIIAILFRCTFLNAQTYIYNDGNANTYKIFTDKIDYIPVTKSESSSGMYSGGEAKTISLGPQQYDSLKTILEEAIATKEFHAQKREKQSGLITKTGKKKKQVILQPRSAIRNKLEKYLMSLNP